MMNDVWDADHVHVIRGGWFCLVVAMMSWSSGCGGSGVNDPDVARVTGLVAGIGDLAARPAQLGELFVEGATPSDLERYGNYGYEVVGPVKIVGDTATVDLRIFGGVIATTAGDKARKPTRGGESTKTWTLRRVGEEWKIEDAPL